MVFTYPLVPVCRDSSQGNGSGPENSGPGGPRRRCLHHRPQGCSCHVGLGPWRYGGLSASHSRGQAGTDFPRRRREPAEAGTGEMVQHSSAGWSLFFFFLRSSVLFNTHGWSAQSKLHPSVRLWHLCQQANTTNVTTETTLQSFLKDVKTEIYLQLASLRRLFAGAESLLIEVWTLCFTETVDSISLCTCYILQHISTWIRKYCTSAACNMKVNTCPT